MALTSVTTLTGSTALVALDGVTALTIGGLIPPPAALGSYFLLEDHYIQNNYLRAGTTATENSELPIGWVPTPNVDPLNTPAVNAFYARGPQLPGRIVTLLVPVEIDPPITRWAPVPNQPNTWQLTGLGASLAPVQATPIKGP